MDTVQEALAYADISTTRRYARLVNGEVDDALRTFRMDDGESPEVDIEATEEGGEERLAALLDEASPEQVAFAQRVLEAAGGDP